MPKKLRPRLSFERRGRFVWWASAALGRFPQTERSEQSYFKLILTELDAWVPMVNTTSTSPRPAKVRGKATLT